MDVNSLNAYLRNSPIERPAQQTNQSSVSAPTVSSNETLQDDVVTISDEALNMGSGTVETQSAGGTTLPGWPPKKTG